MSEQRVVKLVLQPTQIVARALKLWEADPDPQHLDTAITTLSKIRRVVVVQNRVDVEKKRAAWVDKVMRAIPLDAIDHARQFLAVMHDLVPVGIDRGGRRGRSLGWEEKYQQYVTGLHWARRGYMSVNFPLPYLEHMKSCEECGTVQTFNQLVDGFLPNQITPEFCSKTIGFLEARVYHSWNNGMSRKPWKQFEGVLDKLVEVPEFPRVYFRHVLSCTRKCGSWRTFKSVVKRREVLAPPDLRAAMEFLNRDDLRGPSDKLKRPARRYQGLQLLVTRCSQVEPERVRSSLLEALFCMTADQDSARHSRDPFLQDSQFFNVKDVGVVNCSLEKLEKIVLHAERRFKFMLKLLVAIHGDGYLYRGRPAFFGCGIAGAKGTELLHSAITANVDRRRSGNDAWDLCKKGGVFYSHKFLEEINHTIPLDVEYNNVDGWIEDKWGSKGGVRGVMDPIFNATAAGTNDPLQGWWRFVTVLFKANTAAAIRYSQDAKKLEYVKIHQWVFDHVAPHKGEQRKLNPGFFARCVLEDMGAEYVVDLGNLKQLFLDWQKKLLDE